jgi:hypothetical protein
MQITAGKFYKTQEGMTVGPMVWDDVVRVWRNGPNFVRNSGDYWHEDGRRFGHVEDGTDLAIETEPQL